MNLPSTGLSERLTEQSGRILPAAHSYQSGPHSRHSFGQVSIELPTSWRPRWPHTWNPRDQRETGSSGASSHCTKLEVVPRTLLVRQSHTNSFRVLRLLAALSFRVSTNKRCRSSTTYKSCGNKKNDRPERQHVTTPAVPSWSLCCSACQPHQYCAQRLIWKSTHLHCQRAQ